MSTFDRITALRQRWKPYDNRSLCFRGISACLHVMEFPEGRIAVELVPHTDSIPASELENWPVDVLSLSAADQAAIIRDIDDDGDDELP